MRSRLGAIIVLVGSRLRSAVESARRRCRTNRLVWDGTMIDGREQEAKMHWEKKG